MTFDQLKAAVKGYANLTSPEADTRVGEAINRHYRRITSLLGLEAVRFVTRTETTTNGVRTVTFDEIEKIDRIFDTTDSANIRLLTEVSLHTQRSTQPSTGQAGTWALQNTDSASVTVLLDTLPQSTYTLQADGVAAMADLQGTDSPVFPESFHDILVWFVLSEELLKKEKERLALTYEQKAEKLLSDLRFHLADSHTRTSRQGDSAVSTQAGSSGAGGSTLGTTAYTQSALLTFDRGSGIAPFAVAQSNAPVVANLNADKLDDQHGSYYLDRANHTGTFTVEVADISNVTTDRLIGRDAASTGVAEHITVGGGLEFTGSGGIRRSALTGDISAAAGSNATTLAANAVTDAIIRDSAACSVIGRSPNSSGDPADIASSTNNTLLARISNALAWVAGLVFDGAGRVQQIAFAGTQSASSDVNTLDDYEEGTFSPTITGTGGGSGQAYSVQVGSYIKIGKFVAVHGRVVLSTLGTVTGQACIGGLPFTSENTTNQKSTAHIGYWLINSSLSYISGVIEPNTTLIALWGTNEASSLTSFTQANLTNTSELVFSATYRASS